MNFLQRLREPSTWAGLGGLAVSLGANPTKVNATASIVGAILSALAVFLPEGSGGNSTPQS
ncbi:hypothetical protein GJQ57_21090 [Ralstonia pickettii]|uniref:Uncharacterized protein n=1 Tax=Ralstonia pickettii TaxID=329 RepID=A0A7X2HRA5_RALPI|nr:hypothetical protein [Ralstonia pickettii]MRT01147.1 hypothetical protein [Ralstonia pickettii]